jgi:uncharacterized protein (TIGR02001 family)
VARASALVPFLAALGAAPAAQAQVSVSLSLDSQLRIRGLAASDNRPAAVLAVSYDHASGVYGGGSAIAHATDGDDVRYLGHTAYLGYAARRGAAVWDVGVVHQDYSIDGERRFRLRYTEVYGGVSQGPFSARVYYSPNYQRTGSSSLYAELNAAARPAEGWRLTGHVGAFHRLSDRPPAASRERYDVRLGVAREFRGGELRAGVTHMWLSPRPQQVRDRSAVVVGGAVYF